MFSGRSRDDVTSSVHKSDNVRENLEGVFET
jgi:hypothetical protein